MMLCLLLLLLVGTVRCESLCVLTAIAASSVDDSMHENAMGSMEHCHGTNTEHNGLANADACWKMNCNHQDLLASSEFSVTTDTTGLMVAIVLPVVQHAMVPSVRVMDVADIPLPVPISPLQQSSLLRL